MSGRPDATPRQTAAAIPAPLPPAQVEREPRAVSPAPGPASPGAGERFVTQFRRLCRFLHRDLGYLFFGATIAYCVSGLALNHLSDWNPNYSISRQESTVAVAGPDQSFAKADALTLLAQAGVRNKYLNHYSPAAGQVRIFFEGGNATLNRSSGSLVVETVT